MTDTTSPRGLIGTLEEIAATAPEDGTSLGDFVDALGEQAFGVILFAMALPVCIPFLYGVPQVMALPMMALSAQMAMGRGEPWLPAGFKARRIDKPGLVRMARGGRKWFGWLEALDESAFSSPVPSPPISPSTPLKSHLYGDDLHGDELLDWFREAKSGDHEVVFASEVQR